MTTVTEARRELAQIAERQAELQKIVDAAPKSLLEQGGEDGYPLDDMMLVDSFTSYEVRNAYADALDTLLMLRHQPGSEAAIRGDQFLIESCGTKLEIEDWCALDCKLRMISPCFVSEDYAQAAIDTIGADRILRMFRTLHGVAA